MHDLEIIYYSLEIPPEDQLAKHICRLIWKEHGILTTVKEIKSRGNTTLRPEVEALISMYQERMEEIQKKYITFRSSLSPDFLYKDIMTYAQSRGTIYRNEEGHILKYVPNNPGLITLIVIDHIGLIETGKYDSLKEAIDQTSKYLVKFRNWFNFSPLVVTQINRSSEGMDRRKVTDMHFWEPQLSDIKNSGGPSEDANTIIGLASPYYYKIEEYRGFDITRYKDRFRMGKILKNRDGASNIVINFLFLGEIGRYYQLPKASDLDGRQPEELIKLQKYKHNNE